MELHSSHEPSKDWVAHKLLDVLLEHAKYTLYQTMLFMSDKAQNKLVDEIAKNRDKIQSVRLKDGNENQE